MKARASNRNLLRTFRAASTLKFYLGMVVVREWNTHGIPHEAAICRTAPGGLLALCVAPVVVRHFNTASGVGESTNAERRARKHPRNLAGWGLVFFFSAATWPSFKFAANRDCAVRRLFNRVSVPLGRVSLIRLILRSVLCRLRRLLPSSRNREPRCEARKEYVRFRLPRF